MTTVRVLIAVAAIRGWPLFQTPGLTPPAGTFFHIRRAIYELKPAPRAWFERFRRAVLEIG